MAFVVGLQYKYRSRADLWYLDLPVVVKASPSIGGNTRLFGAVGAYAGIGLAGKIVTTEGTPGWEETVAMQVEWGREEYSDQLKRLDYGLSFGGGLEFGNLQAGLSYDLGLANLSNHPMFVRQRINTRVIRLSVAYRLYRFRQRD